MIEIIFKSLYHISYLMNIYLFSLYYVILPAVLRWFCS